MTDAYNFDRTMADRAPGSTADQEVSRVRDEVLADLNDCMRRMQVRISPERLNMAADRIARRELGLERRDREGWWPR